MGNRLQSLSSPVYQIRWIAAAIVACVVTPAHATGTIAGTNISNTATATYNDPSGNPQTVPSNTVTLKVDEVLDVTVVSADPGDVPVAPGSTNQVLSYTVTNTGNGQEAFRLTPNATIGGDQFNPTTTSLVIDTNGNGVYDPGIDTVYNAGTNDPLLNPDQSIRVFVLSTIPGGSADNDRGAVDLTAISTTVVAAGGSNTPGTLIAGQGQGGSDAVIGATSGDGVDRGQYIVQSATVTFTKSASVLNPFGQTAPVPGSIVTYTLVANVSGTGTLSNLTISDAIPANTTFQAGTITLQGGPITDLTDADAGEFSAATVNVRLGNVAGGTTRTVTFKVKIN
jgi:uncharacterized repeat protein (TIGR01451 family)